MKAITEIIHEHAGFHKEKKLIGSYHVGVHQHAVASCLLEKNSNKKEYRSLFLPLEVSKFHFSI